MSEKETPRRDGGRYAAVLPAKLRLEGRDYACSAYDLSRAGVRLVGDLPRPDLPDVEVTIETPTGDLRLRARAQPVHYRDGEEPAETSLGLQFLDLVPDQTEVLERLVARVVEGMAPAALEGIEPHSPADRIRGALAKIPQPHRIALARRGQKKEREILRHDGNGKVLEALARNPNLTAPEAIGLARLPHLLPTTLAVLAEDPRWIANEELRIMIATHPRATFPTADRIVSRMNDLTVQRVLRRPGLNPGVREKLMLRLARKHRG